jgi:hypothetical protein
VALRHPPRQIEIIGELAAMPILPILQTMLALAKGIGHKGHLPQ